MKFKNAVFANEKFMETLVKCNTFEEWPPKDAYWFNRFVKKMGSAQEDYDDVRVKLIKKHGEEDEDVNTTIIKENMEAFTTDFNEMSFWCFVASPYHAFCAPVQHFANVCYFFSLVAYHNCKLLVLSHNRQIFR